jgi:5-enolpyruvylshikimate-3-phosphate synthase
MGLAVAGLASKGGVEVEDIEAASVSYPGFLDDLGRLSCR